LANPVAHMQIIPKEWVPPADNSTTDISRPFKFFVHRVLIV
jgi:hypothetical protein